MKCFLDLELILNFSIVLRRSSGVLFRRREVEV